MVSGDIFQGYGGKGKFKQKINNPTKYQIRGLPILTLMFLVTTMVSSDIFQDYGGTGKPKRISATCTKYL